MTVILSARLTAESASIGIRVYELSDSNLMILLPYSLFICTVAYSVYKCKDTAVDSMQWIVLLSERLTAQSASIEIRVSELSDSDLMILLIYSLFLRTMAYSVHNCKNTLQWTHWREAQLQKFLPFWVKCFSETLTVQWLNIAFKFGLSESSNRKYDRNIK